MIGRSNNCERDEQRRRAPDLLAAGSALARHACRGLAPRPTGSGRSVRRRPSDVRRRRGVIIVVVTVVILLVSLAAYGFLTLVQTENKAAFARGDQLQAQAVAASGREYLAALLELPRADRPVADELAGGSELFADILVDGDPDATDQDARQGRFSILCANTAEVADGLTDSTWQFGYENESAKLHLALVLELERRKPGAGRDALLNLPEMDEATADSILDWIDPDNRPRDQGAELDYYAGLSPPRRPRNAVPPTLEELLLVKGVTREKLFGIDLNGNYQVDAFEEQLAQEQAESGVEGAIAWCHYLTVYSAERDEMSDGQPRIRLNQSDLAALHRELSSVFKAEWANYIVAYRQHGPAKRMGKLRSAAQLPMDFSQPAQRSIRSPLELIGTRVELTQERAGRSKDSARTKKSKPVRSGRAGSSAGSGASRKAAKSARSGSSAGSGASRRAAKPARSGSSGASTESGSSTKSTKPVRSAKPARSGGGSAKAAKSTRSGKAKKERRGSVRAQGQAPPPKVEVFESPFSSDANEMREYLPKLLDAVTAGDGKPLQGRVNVNLAPPEVLAALPGIDRAAADRIVSARATMSGDAGQRQHAVWLMLEGIVDRKTMLQLERYVTTGGDVGSAQIIGYYDHRSPIMRFDTVIDGTFRPARQVYYRDLRRLGRGVADQLMEMTVE